MDINNEKNEEEHLTEILKHQFYLQCDKCCSLYKTVSSFIEHVKDCGAEPKCKTDGKEKLTCALCWKEMSAEQWPTHQMDEHYNVAWPVGGDPVNIKNQNILIQYIDKYKAKYGLKCRLCGATRASALGFYAHVVACKKTEEEIDMYKDICNICEKKYFYFYRYQHMAYHTQQGLRTLKGEIIQKEMEKNKEIKAEEEVTLGRGGRRAAQKARNIIQKFKEGVKENAFSDSDDSCKPEDESEESDDSDHDSNISAEENNQTYQGSDESDSMKPVGRKRIGHYGERNLIPRFPISSNAKSVLKEFGLEFHEQNLISKNLFPELRNFDSELVLDDILHKYLPPLERSCKLQFTPGEWTTVNRFDSTKLLIKGLKSTFKQVLFTGGYVGSMSWAPPCRDDSTDFSQYLAVVGHCNVDEPRLNADDLSSGPGLIQIWDFGDFSRPAEFVFGIAHDFGYVSEVEWCPAGARDSFPKDVPQDGFKRLGLLCAACSDGAAYIFSVPYPSTIVKKESTEKIYKLKPVVELKLIMNSERRLYSATCLSWSKQNGHQLVVVGYSDGTMAYYDLNTESPFLKIQCSDRIILNPYHDEQLHNNCITGLDTYPSLQKDNLAGALCSSSVSGAALLAWPGVRPVRQQIISSVGNCHFQPLWPSSIVVGDEANLSSSINEVDWWGLGRRFGGGSAAAGCWWCGQVAISPTPLLRVCYTHPIDRPRNGMKLKKTFGVIQMTPLSGKKRKLKNDDYQVKMEPTTYQDAIEKYGLELRFDKEVIEESDNMRHSFPEKTPERFPLSEVTSMAFCPAAAHHNKLAVATHSGCVFLFTV